jgi:hypothetical protein
MGILLIQFLLFSHSKRDKGKTNRRALLNELRGRLYVGRCRSVGFFGAAGKAAGAFHFWCIQSNQSRRGFSSRKVAHRGTRLCRVEVKML